MTDEQRQRIHDIEYSNDGRTELAERIVGLEDELAKWERLTAGIQLPEYPISEFQPKDLERENAELSGADGAADNDSAQQLRHRRELGWPAPLLEH